MAASVVLNAIAREFLRDFVLDRVPSSGVNPPSKAKGLAWTAAVATILDALEVGQGEGTLVYGTRAALFANLIPGAHAKAEVYADGTPAYNGVYEKSGATGTGAWTKVSDLAVTALGGRVADVEAIAGPLQGIDFLSVIAERLFVVADDEGFVDFSVEPGLIRLPGGSTLSWTPDSLFEVVDSEGFVHFRIANDGTQYPLIPSGSGGGQEESLGQAVRIWTDALTHQGFRVAFDIEGGSMRSVCQVEVSTNDDFSVIAARSPVTIPTATQKDADSYWRSVVSDAFTGLMANTQYFGRVIVDGLPSQTFKVKTAPTPHDAADFSFLLFSCTELSSDPLEVVNSHRAMAQEEGVLFNLHTGDIDYSNINQSGMGLWRSRNTRQYRDHVDVQALLALWPTVYIYDDHDSGPNDNHWDMTVPGTTMAEVYKACRRAYRETVPAHPFVQTQLGETDPDKVLPVRVFDIAKARFIVLDCRTQRRFAEGTPTMLGTGTNPPGSWDQLGWLTGTALPAAATAAAANQINNLFIVSSTAWTADVYGAWGSEWGAERTAICDALAATIDTDVLPITILTGDLHWSAAGAGEGTDFSTGAVLGNGIRQIMSSPAKRDSKNAGGPIKWGAATIQILDFEQYCRIDVKGAGGWVATFKGSPYDPDTFEPTEKAEGPFDTADLT